MSEKKITLKGNPIEVMGPTLKAGDKAPDFCLQTTDTKDERLSTTANKTRIVLAVPSLDTPVCATETRRFNQEAGKLQNTDVLVASMDLPFGLKRFCGAENIANVRCLSGHRDTSFGEAYGVLIKGGPLDRCYARAAFVIGPDDKLKYVEYVNEIAAEPNYDAIIAAAQR